MDDLRAGVVGPSGGAAADTAGARRPRAAVDPLHGRRAVPRARRHTKLARGMRHLSHTNLSRKAREHSSRCRARGAHNAQPELANLAIEYCSLPFNARALTPPHQAQRPAPFSLFTVTTVGGLTFILTNTLPLKTSSALLTRAHRFLYNCSH